MCRTIALSISALVCCSSFPAAAQAPDTLQLEPIVVTATRLPTPRGSVAATVTVLDGEALRRQGIDRVLDALRSVPGVNVVQSGSFGANTSVLVRGGESDYVKVLVDGVPINDPGGAFDFANLTLDNVDRIELVRGPASVLYGSDAAAGVVEIFTRRGAGKPRAEVGVRGGTFASKAVSGSLTGGADNVDLAFAFSRATTDGIYAFNNDYDHLELSGSIGVHPDARTDAKLMVRYSDSDFHFPTDGAGQVVDRNARQLQDRVVGSLSAGRWLTGWLEARVQLAVHETDGGIDDAPDSPADSLGFFGFRSSQNLERRSGDLRANVYVFPDMIVSTGAMFERQQERSVNESQSQFGNSTGTVAVERRNTGYYAQLQAAPVSGLAVNGGVRVDDNDAFGTFVTYRVGATYRLPTGTRVRASAGKAFKEPTFFESFSQTPFALGNPALQPERSTAWEVGVEQRLFHGRVHAGVTVFDQQFRDLIQYTATPPDSDGPYFFNVAAADASGLEVETEGTWGNVTLGGNYTYLDTEVNDAGFDTGAGAAFVAGERLLRRPTHTLTLSARYRFRERGTVSVALHHVGEREDRDFSSYPANPVALPSYNRVDVAVSYPVLLKRGRQPGFDVRARVENLFDVAYQEVFGFPARMRMVMVGGGVRF